MSTSGVAHHQTGTFPQYDTETECARRKARYAARDAAYRAALGLNHEEPLPGAIGNTSGAGKAIRYGWQSQSGGGRIRLRSIGL